MKHFSFIIILSTILSWVYLPLLAENEEDCTIRVTRHINSENSYLYCRYNSCTMTADIVQRNVATKPYYDRGDILIPRTFSIPNAVIGENGSSNSSLTYTVVAIDEGAFINCTASSFAFTLPSNIQVIRRQALSEMNNMTGELALPEGLTLIEEKGIYTGFTSLVIPSTVDSLSISAILLEKVERIEFLGSVPPRCAVDGDLTPWNTEDVFTPKDVTIVVPDGSFTAYQDQKGIGDYFTCFKKDTPSALNEASERVSRPGIYSLTGVYLGTNVDELPRGMYIIDGHKVVK